MGYLKFCDAYARFLSRLILVFGFGLVISVFLQVLGRYVPFIPLWLWPQEIINVSFVWIVFTGSAVALRTKDHFTVDVFPMLLKGMNVSWFYGFLDILYYAIGFLMAYIFSYYGFIFFRDWGMIQTSDITGINMGYLYFSVPLAGVTWAMFLIESIIKQIIAASKGVRQ